MSRRVLQPFSRVVADKLVLRTPREQHFASLPRRFNSMLQQNSEQNRSLDTEFILGGDSKKSVIQRLQNDQRREQFEGLIKTPSKLSAVLVPLCKVDGDLSVLFTLRSMSLRSHQGQVSFPGGNMSENDQSAADTALRETEEEIGFAKENVDVWTEMMRIPAPRNRANVITPVIGYLGDLDIRKLTPNADEVADVFTVPVNHFLAAKNQGYTKWTNGMTTPMYKNTKHCIWGMTASLLDLFLSHAYPNAYKSIIASLPWDKKA